MKTIVILLIDFVGHSSFDDPTWPEVRRFNNLISKLSKYWEIRDNLVIVNNSSNPSINATEPSERNLAEIRSLGHTRWIDVEPRTSVQDIINKLADCGVDTKNMLVTIGGTNTRGCCYDYSSIGALAWIGAGYEPIIDLSICHDYFEEGSTSADRQYNALVKLLNKIRDDNVIDKMRVMNGIHYPDFL